MNKWPYKIKKVKSSLAGIKGYAWFDRWHENIWFESFNKIYIPLEVERLLKTLSFTEQLNFSFKLVYCEDIPKLISNKNPFLSLIPKTENIFNPVTLMSIK